MPKYELVQTNDGLVYCEDGKAVTQPFNRYKLMAEGKDNKTIFSVYSNMPMKLKKRLTKRSGNLFNSSGSLDPSVLITLDKSQIDVQMTKKGTVRYLLEDTLLGLCRDHTIRNFKAWEYNGTVYSMSDRPPYGFRSLTLHSITSAQVLDLVAGELVVDHKALAGVQGIYLAFFELWKKEMLVELSKRGFKSVTFQE
jgi:hypothetical protein